MKKILLLFITFIITTSTFAQIDEVQLVVSGIADTKENAITTALRSAIEQAFGTFVSANTEIVNDELTKDEIVTISSGNIKKYEEISSILLPNNQHSVTLNAVVSVKKLTTFAQSHGSSCELAGNVFAENMRLKELNKRNEETALKHLEKQLRILEENLFDISIIAGEPKIYKTKFEEFFGYNPDASSDNNTHYKVPITLVIKSTENSNSYLDLYFSTLNSLKLSEQEIEDYNRINLCINDFYVYSIDEYYEEDGYIFRQGSMKDKEIYSAKFRSKSIPILKPYRHLERVFIKINGIEKSENILINYKTKHYEIGAYTQTHKEFTIPNSKLETIPFGFYLPINSAINRLYYTSYTREELDNFVSNYQKASDKEMILLNYDVYSKYRIPSITYKNLSSFQTIESNNNPKRKSKKNQVQLKKQFITSIEYEIILTAEELSKVTGFEIVYK
jgi:hypothetical protein